MIKCDRIMTRDKRIIKRTADDRWRWILALTTGSAALLSHYVMVVTDMRVENRK